MEVSLLLHQKWLRRFLCIESTPSYLFSETAPPSELFSKSTPKLCSTATSITSQLQPSSAISIWLAWFYTTSESPAFTFGTLSSEPSPRALPSHHKQSSITIEWRHSLFRLISSHSRSCSSPARGSALSTNAWRSMLRAYAANSMIQPCRQLFDEIPDRYMMCWNAMLACYSQAGLHEETLKTYEWMMNMGVDVDEFTLVNLLSSCAHVGALGLGERIHQFAGRSAFLDNVYVGNALIDMYAKCGCIDGARHVFERMQHRDSYTWNSLIVGLGVHGRGDEAIAVLQQMSILGFRPNSVSFVGAVWMQPSRFSQCGEGVFYENEH